MANDLYHESKFSGEEIDNAVSMVINQDDPNYIPRQIEQLLSGINDVVEGYFNKEDGEFYEEYEDGEYAIKIEREEGRLYIDKNTNQTYRFKIDIWMSETTDGYLFPIDFSEYVCLSVDMTNYPTKAEMNDKVKYVGDEIAILKNQITELKNTVFSVDTSDIVLDTIFPYSVNTNKTYWSKTCNSYVESPTFYTTLKANTLGGVKTISGISWRCVDDEGYNSSHIGSTYHFQPVLPTGYTWIGDAQLPTITVKIIDAGWGKDGAIQGFSYATDGLIPYVIKAVSDTQVAPYDATGCNRLTPEYAITSSAEVYVGGMNYDGTGKTHFAGATTGDAKLTITGGAKFDSVYGAGRAVAHNDDVYIFVNDATVNGVHAAGRGTSADVGGNVYIDVSGKVTIGSITGSGVSNYKDGITVEGIVKVTIHDLDKDSTIGAIRRTYANNLEVYLDDSSASLLNKVENWTTDENVKVYINGILQGSVTELILAEGNEAIELIVTNIPADAEVVWSVEGDAVTLENGFVTPVKGGTATVRAIVDGVATIFEITVESTTVAVTGVTITDYEETTVESVGDSTHIVVTVEPEDATNKNVVVSSSNEFVAVVGEGTNEEEGWGTHYISAVGVGSATITATTEDGGFTDSIKVNVLYEDEEL